MFSQTSKRLQTLKNAEKFSDADMTQITELEKNLKKLYSPFNIYTNLAKIEKEKADLQQILLDDPELRELSALELKACDEKINKILNDTLNRLFAPRPQNEVLLQISAGVGGLEANLFAWELFGMYKKYAALKNWSCAEPHLAKCESAGMKEGHLLIRGEGALERLQFEAGCHRVQRVPVTEKKGNVHTSIVKVLVLSDLGAGKRAVVDKKDVTVDTYRSSGPGGQHKNKTESAVRIRHAPSGLVFTCDKERSQHKNRTTAWKRLQDELQSRQLEEARGRRLAEKKGQMQTGDRSEKIRTYNWADQRIKDHRSNAVYFELHRMMRGELLDQIVDELRARRCERIIETLDEDNFISNFFAFTVVNDQRKIII